MKEELDKKLCEEFPILYRDRNAAMTETCLCWGFSCGDGWYDLIHTLSLVIENTLDNAKISGQYNYKRKHSIDLSNDLNEEQLKEVGNPKVIVTQVKEKFGGLRFYIYFDGITEYTKECVNEIYGHIEMAEAMSYNICEECGKPGTQSKGGWIRTLCEEHHKEYQ